MHMQPAQHTAPRYILNIVEQVPEMRLIGWPLPTPIGQGVAAGAHHTEAELSQGLRQVAAHCPEVVRRFGAGGEHRRGRLDLALEHLKREARANRFATGRQHCRRGLADHLAAVQVGDEVFLFNAKGEHRVFSAIG